VSERIEWDEDAAHHIRTRSERYPDAVDIEPDWTAEAVNDPDRIVDEPDPHSAHANSVRVVDYSPSASLVVTVVALRDQHGVLHGATAWRSNSKQRRQYQEGAVDD
jgi:hypothetical protein